jgi:hypothetical protein
MFELISEHMMNAFSIRMKIADFEKKLASKRTPKKYHESLKSEISRLEKLYTERRKSEAGRRQKR